MSNEPRPTTEDTADPFLGRKVASGHHFKDHVFVAGREPGWYCVKCGHVELGDVLNPVAFGWCRR